MDNVRHWTTFDRVKWRRLDDWYRYEISNEGQVRVREGFRNAGLVLTRFWRNGHSEQRGGEGSVPLEETDDYSLCVELWDGTRHTIRRVHTLMAKYWPRVDTPEYWKPTKHKGKITKEDVKQDGRRKLTDAQIEEIKASDLTPTELSRTGKYPVTRRHISKIKNGV